MTDKTKLTPGKAAYVQRVVDAKRASASASEQRPVVAWVTDGSKTYESVSEWEEPDQ